MHIHILTPNFVPIWNVCIQVTTVVIYVKSCLGMSFLPKSGRLRALVSIGYELIPKTIGNEDLVQQWMKGHKVWLKPKVLWAYKQARWMTCCCGIFCSRFDPILSPLKIILEMIFWTNLMLDLICTWLEKTRRFCRQVNKKISSCFWTASTCVQRSSLGWCSRLTYMETVDWIHVGLDRDTLSRKRQFSR